MKRSVVKLSRFRQWRTANGLTLQEVGDVVGLSEAMVSLLERGKRKARPETKVKIARRLGVRVADLFAPEDLP